MTQTPRGVTANRFIKALRLDGFQEQLPDTD
jgi:predicted RNA binding protein YcfA (HicA-like mRNA interferase family)